MSAALTADDLATYLGQPVDDDRADMLIADAQALCEAIVTPLPAGGDAIVRRAAARAYVNPTGISQETVGPYTVQRSSSVTGVYLTPTDRRALRSLDGRSGAFSIDLLPADAGAQLPQWDTNAGVDQIATS